MPSRAFRDSWQIARRLLALEARNERGDGRRIRTFPALLGLANLFLCGGLDHYLRSDHDGSMVSLFLFAEASLLVFVAIGSFMRTGGEIIRKTSVFPISPLGRLLFVVWGNLRRSASVALWFTSCLFLAVFHASHWPTALVSVGLFGLLVINVEVVTALVTLWLARTSRPIHALAVLSVLAALIIPTGSLLLGEQTLLRTIPLIASVAGGIAAMSAGQPGAVAVDFVVLGGVLLIWYHAGKALA